MSIEIVPTNAVLGAEIRGVDLARPLDEATFCEIERAFNTHAVIFSREQGITPPQQVAFTRRFGEIEFNVFGERWSVPGSPEIVVVSNATENVPWATPLQRRKNPVHDGRGFCEFAAPWRFITPGMRHVRRWGGLYFDVKLNASIRSLIAGPLVTT